MNEAYHGFALKSWVTLREGVEGQEARMSIFPLNVVGRAQAK